ncbi:esterase/lipase family protein [Deinococcus cellulosilyticus]|uniref:Alpha/beta hydrolase n=1 Tax=Deinococcus cellulosilyticus (strain DSM 18568 / NBRC 106333 / KACC 11606 / 5516J-15) TaxID=1223518 RepID=A0A511MX31_DEIC1|nr:alpha/beta fold hydrolase [Deinococcus cellulosilyticus]GEM44931.1 alpha/beta hydrolase [Deinococcus cellulosilyticus NBRC 106333 = KACC 11606]
MKREPVVMVHGINDSSAGLRTMRQVLEHHGHQVYAPDLKPNDGRHGIKKMAESLRDYINLKIPEGEFDLIAFSMGGIISRYYLQRLGGLERVKRIILISSPHQGTIWGHVYPLPGVRDMAVGSNLLKELNTDVDLLGNKPCLTVWTPYDVTIFPAQHCILPHAENYEVKVWRHGAMMKDPRVIKRVVEFLDQEPHPARETQAQF